MSIKELEKKHGTVKQEVAKTIGNPLWLGLQELQKTIMGTNRNDKKENGKPKKAKEILQKWQIPAELEAREQQRIEKRKYVSLDN